MSTRRGALLAILLSTMTASSFHIFALAVLAVELIEDLDISRTALGLLGSLNTAVGAVTAPSIGRLTDRIGAKRAVVIVLAISGLGMAVMALSTTWEVLAASAVVSGIPQGWGNPATNALIAEQVPVGARGTVTGIKQSGVQLGIFVSGITLPALSLAVGWRGAMWGFAGLFAVTAFAVRRGLASLGDVDPAPPPDTERAAATPNAEATPDAEAAPAAGGSPVDDRSPAMPTFIWLLTVYAFSSGTAGGAIGRFFPLWAHEEVGQSTVVAGVLVGIGGLLGIGARILAGQAAEELLSPTRLLSLLALVGAAYCAILLLTTTVGAWVLWPGTVLSAIGIGAWNAVAMLAVIMAVPRRAAGRASGIVMLGFLGGLTIGSPIAGWVVDRWGTYQPVWLGALLLTLLSAAVLSSGRLRSPAPVGAA